MRARARARVRVRVRCRHQRSEDARWEAIASQHAGKHGEHLVRVRGRGS